MCDKAAYEGLSKRVTELEKNQEVHDARSEERFKTIFGIMKWVISFMLTITMILLLTVIYGAIGERGFHSLERGFNSLMPHV